METQSSTIEINHQAVGRPLSRVDGNAKVTGQARYTAEWNLPGLAHAYLVQSEIAHGRILSLDTTQAESAPGVLFVLTHDNMPRLAVAPEAISNGPQGGSQGGEAQQGGGQKGEAGAGGGGGGQMGGAGQKHIPMQDDAIVHDRQHVALVVAETFEQARYASTLIRPHYHAERPRIALHETMQHLSKPEKVWGEQADTHQGDVRSGIAEAEVEINAIYHTAFQHHNTMEPHATVAVWNGDELTLYEPSTWVYGVRKTVAAWLQMPKEKIRVVQEYVGGSFGGKGPTWPHVALAAIAARKAGRPVKLVLSRQQEFAGVGYRPHIQHRIHLGATRDGTLTALIHDAVAQTALFDDRVVAPVTKSSRKLYACPNVGTNYRLAHGNLPGPFTMRGPGETPGLFALKSAMDELAYALNLDPIELRLRNYAENDPETGKPWSSKSLRECYRQGAEQFGWSKRNPTPRNMTTTIDGEEWLVGYGMASMAYDAKTSPVTARARLRQDGMVVVQSATCDQGTGSYTVMRQIASDSLGLPTDNIRFELGDTALPEAPISAGSQTAASVGSAVQKVCQSLRAKAVALARSDPASPLANVAESAIAVDNGRLFAATSPNLGETYGELLRRHGLPALEIEEKVDPGEAATDVTRYSFGAHFSEVRVCPSSGEVRIARHVAAFGAGRILNPKTAHSQLIGGIIWGIGMALHERTVFDEHRGRIMNADLAEYHVPVNADMPDITAFFVEEHDEKVNPLGVKGIGEIGTIGASAAIANAIYHATGKRIRSVPITPDKLL